MDFWIFCQLPGVPSLFEALVCPFDFDVAETWFGEIPFDGPGLWVDFADAPFVFSAGSNFRFAVGDGVRVS